MVRKLAAARRGDGDGSRSALRALRLALARAASEELGLALAVIAATQTRCTTENLAGRLDGERLFLLLDGPGGKIGGLSLDRSFVTALVQHQTTGRVAGGDSGDRVFTATDAALAAPLIDAALDRAAALAEAAADRMCLEAYRYGARAEDGRGLVLALEAERFRRFDLTIDIAAGAAQGAMCLILPDREETPAGDDAQAIRGPGLEQAFGVMRADLMAVVGRMRVPLSRLAAMRPGDCLPLPEGRIERTELVGLHGRCVASGRLGQSGGFRALRLNETPPDPAGTAHGEPEFEPRPSRRPVATAAQDDGAPGRAGPIAAQPDADAEEFENHLMRLSPQEAAVEISALAGLPAPVAGDDGPPPAGVDR